MIAFPVLRMSRCTPAQAALAAAHSNLPQRVVKELTHRLPWLKSPKLDPISVATVALVEAAIAWSSEGVPFAQFATVSIQQRIKQDAVRVLRSPTNTKALDCEPPMPDFSQRDELRAAVKRLPRKFRRILESRLRMGKPDQRTWQPRGPRQKAILVSALEALKRELQ